MNDYKQIDAGEYFRLNADSPKPIGLVVPTVRSPEPHAREHDMPRTFSVPDEVADAVQAWATVNGVPLGDAMGTAFALYIAASAATAEGKSVGTARRPDLLDDLFVLHPPPSGGDEPR